MTGRVNTCTKRSPDAAHTSRGGARGENSKQSEKKTPAPTTSRRGERGENPTQSEKKSPGPATTGGGARRENPKQSEQKLPAHHGKGTHRKSVAPQKPDVPLSKSPTQELERPAVPRTNPTTQESARHDSRGSRKNDEPSRVLNRTVKKLKIKKEAKCEASKVKNEIVEKIKTHLDKTRNFNGMQTLPTGSYFENLKIGDPDEFDVMFTILADRVDVQRFGTDGAYYSVKFKRHPQRHVLKEFLLEDDTICASKMMKEFRREVKEAVKTVQIQGDLKVEPKKTSSPAVTLTLNVDGREISFDIVLGIEVRGSWPPCAKNGMDGIENWLGTKVKQELKFKPFYLVPKHEGSANKEKDGVLAKDVWRISFSHVEKDIMKKHGSEKTCCESKGRKCCRKQCLMLLKHLLAELKAQHPSELSKFCSYQAKTTLLHACTVRANDNDWEFSDLHYCFQLLLQDFVGHLRLKQLPNFFIPTHNLLSLASAEGCKKLANYIEHELNNGFPIFKKGLKD